MRGSRDHTWPPHQTGGTRVPRDSRGSERPPAHTSCPWCLQRSPQAAGEVVDPSWTESQAAATLGLAGTPLCSPEMTASHITPSVEGTSAGHHTSSRQRQTLPGQWAGRRPCTLSPRATARGGPREPLNRQQQSLFHGVPKVPSGWPAAAALGTLAAVSGLTPRRRKQSWELARSIK